MGICLTRYTPLLSAATAVFSTNVTHIATGSGTTAPLVGDTTLETETYREVAISTNTATTSFTIEIFQDISENNVNNIAEVGVFDAGSGGNMYSRNLTNIIQKSNTNEVFLEVQFNISIS